MRIFNIQFITLFYPMEINQLLPLLIFQFTTNRNAKVILCKFNYDLKIIAAFKQNFPSAKWSRSLSSW